MFKFFLLSNFFRLVTLAALVFFIALFFYAYKLEQKNAAQDPKSQAFMNTMGKPNISESLGVNENPMATQNIASREIVKMLGDIIPEVLSFNNENFNTNKGLVQKYFTDEGYNQYLLFLDTAGFNSNLIEQNLQSGVFIEQPPLEISSGVYNGYYKWLFEVPVTVYFVPVTTQDNDLSTVSTSTNKRAKLRIQFTRVEDPNDPDAIKMEIWQAVSPQNR